MIQPVLLWSDALIFLLTFAVAFFIYQVRRNEQARKRWRKVFASKVGMSAFVVICVYASVALLDSLHFREPLSSVATEVGAETKSDIESVTLAVAETPKEIAYSADVKSVLDLVLSDLNALQEKTYSAPLSIYSFSKENVTDEQGRIYRDYPRLAMAGSHLMNESDHAWDITMLSLIGVLNGILVAMVLIVMHIWYRGRTLHKIAGVTLLPWRTAYFSLAIIAAIIGWMMELGAFYHILGTDKVGSDVLVQSIKAIRTGVLIGTLATVLTLPIAILLGISAGYFKGWIDDLIQYIYTTLSSIPGILLIAASVLLIDVYIGNNPQVFELTAQRADFKFLALCAILGLTSWTTLCRLLRAETLKVSQLDYVQAAHAFGVSHMRVIGKHILPNITHIILIALVLDFSAFVLAEAVLSYIGVGVDPSMHSWGNMINAARSELSRDPAVWWSVTSAFLLMFTLVLAANLFSDEVREAFDPRSAKGTH